MRLLAAVVTALLLLSQARPSDEVAHALTVTGILSRAMAIGGESTGWSIQLDAPIHVNGKDIQFVEISYEGVGTLKGLENKRVVATGTLTTTEGVERGARSVLLVYSISKTQTDAAGALSLENTEWRLQDLAGRGVIDNSRASLSFAEPHRVTGNTSCNRFFGSITIAGDRIHFGVLGATRMMCSEAVMHQETKYLEALASVERFEWKTPYLLLYANGFDKPLKFTKKN